MEIYCNLCEISDLDFKVRLASWVTSSSQLLSRLRVRFNQALFESSENRDRREDQEVDIHNHETQRLLPRN